MWPFSSSQGSLASSDLWEWGCSKRALGVFPLVFDNPDRTGCPQVRSFTTIRALRWRTRSTHFPIGLLYQLQSLWGQFKRVSKSAFIEHIISQNSTLYVHMEDRANCVDLYLEVQFFAPKSIKSQKGGQVKKNDSNILPSAHNLSCLIWMPLLFFFSFLLAQPPLISCG